MDIDIGSGIDKPGDVGAAVRVGDLDASPSPSVGPDDIEGEEPLVRRPLWCFALRGVAPKWESRRNDVPRLTDGRSVDTMTVANHTPHWEVRE